MRIYFCLISAALGFAAVSGAAMAWDGSYILFKILDLQAPMVAHNRFVNIPLHWIVLLASRLTDDLTMLQMVFGLVYASIPFLALALSWWVVRGQAETLFIWAALGIGLGTLPGQFCFVCEAIYVIFLFWPIILALLTGMRKYQVPVIVLLVIAAFFTHFIASLLFAFSAVLAFAIGLCSRDDRRWMWMWAFGLSIIALLKLLTLWLFPSGYEMSMLSIDVLKSFFIISVAGVPLVSIMCAWLAGSIIFFSGLFMILPKRNFLRIIQSTELVSLMTAGVLLVIWARDPYLWKYAIGFRLWALFSSFPFMILATFEALIHRHNYLYTKNIDLHHRIKTARIVGVIFLLVLFVQSTSWFNLTKALRETITQSENSCISGSSIDLLARGPLDGWSTPYAILLQGRTPQKLVLYGDGCSEASLSEAVRLAPWDLRSRMGGWFDLRLSGLSSSQER